MSGYQIVIIRPEGYPHSSAFQEVAETLLYGLRSLHHQVAISENKVDATRTNIVLGAHLLTAESFMEIPPGSIIFNLEQLASASLPHFYLKLAGCYQIWDYSPLNVDIWSQYSPLLYPPQLVEVGYVPQLRRIAPAPVQDIDVLFYGCVNERRRELLLRLEQAGIGVQAIFGVYGRDRDALIARSKIVLNLHAYEARLFQSVRVSYLLANSKAVLSEDAPDMGDYAQAIAVAEPGQLVERCLQLLANDEERHALERAGHDFFRRRDQTAILRAIVGEGQPAEPQKIVLTSKVTGNGGAGSDGYFQSINKPLYDSIPDARNILELGCAGGRLGELYKQEHPGAVWTGIDINADALEFAGQRLDRVFHLDVETQDLSALGTGYDCIVLGDVLEHLRTPEKLLEALHEITTPDAVLVISVPNMSHISVLERMLIGDICYDNAGLLDSTHLRFLSQSSFFKLLLDSGWLPSICGRTVMAPRNPGFTEQIFAAAATLGSSRAAAEVNFHTYQMMLRCPKSPAWASRGKAAEPAARPGRFSVLVALNNALQAELNVLRSPGLQEVGAEIILCAEAGNAADAFERAARQASCEWLLYCHQDVYFPAGTGHAIEERLAAIPVDKRAEALLGFAGVGVEQGNVRHAGLVVERHSAFDHPGTETGISLDELAVVLHRDSPLRIDPGLGWHLWATDLCMQALHHPEGERYAQILRVPIYHNSLTDWTLPQEFLESANVLSAKFPDLRVIPTLCGMVTRDGPQAVVPY